MDNLGRFSPSHTTPAMKLLLFYLPIRLSFTKSCNRSKATCNRSKATCNRSKATCNRSKAIYLPDNLLLHTSVNFSTHQ